MSSDPRENLLIRFVQPGGGEALTIPAPHDLRYSVEVPGWFKDLSCSIHLPVGVPRPPALTQNGEVALVDRRNARIIWYGRLDDPGQSTTTPAGTKYALTAKGGQQVMDGFRERYGLVDRASSSWLAVGDFAGGSADFTGDLSPVDDLTPDDLSGYGDAIDFGGELGIDFGGDLGDLGSLGDLGGNPFGGDLGDWGGIQSGGTLYPKPSSYPGYLGFLKDPAGVPGDQLPIPLGGGSTFWAPFEEGTTGAGGTATGDTTGTLTPGTGPIRRKYIGTTGGPLGIGGLMMEPGMLDSYASAYWADFGVGHAILGSVDVIFTLHDASAVAEVWYWADGTLSTDGWVTEVSLTDITISEVLAGVKTQLATASWSGVVGTRYRLQANVVPEAPQLPDDTGDPYDVLYPTYWAVAATVQDAASLTTLGSALYEAPAFESSDGLWIGRYALIHRDINQPTGTFFTDMRYWGLGASGGPVEFEVPYEPPGNPRP